MIPETPTVPDLVLPSERQSHARASRKPRLVNATDALHLTFGQGITEAIALARTVKLYAKHGLRIAVDCQAAYQQVSADFGLIADTSSKNSVPFLVPSSADCDETNVNMYWTYNRSAAIVGRDTLPAIDATPEQLWSELKSTKLDTPSRIPKEIEAEVGAYLMELPKPIFLINAVTNIASAKTSLPRDIIADVYRNLLDKSPGTLVVADWEGTVPRLGCYRIRHLSDTWAEADMMRTLALAQAADVVLSVESGILQLASLTETPIVNVSLFSQSYPTRTSLPRAQTVNIVPFDVCHKLNRKVRIEYNMIETPRGSASQAAATISAACLACLEKPVYLTEDLIGADIQLQQFVLDWERGYETPLSGYVDRHRGYDALFREIKNRFVEPHIVETSTISREETWRIDGYSTYLLGAFLQRYGGRLTSVDPNSAHAEFAARVLTELPCVATVSNEPSVYLISGDEPIDVLMVNGDESMKEHEAERALSYVRTAEKRLHENSIVVLDDTPYFRGAYTGRGSLAAPWLLERGWHVMRSGYQTIFVRHLND